MTVRVLALMGRYAARVRQSVRSTDFQRTGAGFLEDRAKATALAKLAGPWVRAIDPLVGERVSAPKAHTQQTDCCCCRSSILTPHWLLKFLNVPWLLANLMLVSSLVRRVEVHLPGVVFAVNLSDSVLVNGLGSY